MATYNIIVCCSDGDRITVPVEATKPTVALRCALNAIERDWTPEALELVEMVRLPIKPKIQPK